MLRFIHFCLTNFVHFTEYLRDLLSFKKYSVFDFNVKVLDN